MFMNYSGVTKFYECFFGEAGKDYVDKNPNQAFNKANLLLEEMTNKLTDEEIFILKHRFNLLSDPLTLEDLSIKLNKTKEEVMEMTNVALRKLKHPTNFKVVLEILIGQTIEEKDEEKPKVLLSTSIDDLLLNGLGVRTYNVLKRNNINTVSDLIKCDREYLIEIKIGKQGLKEIEDLLKRL